MLVFDAAFGSNLAFFCSIKSLSTWTTLRHTQRIAVNWGFPRHVASRHSPSNGTCKDCLLTLAYVLFCHLPASLLPVVVDRHIFHQIKSLTNVKFMHNLLSILKPKEQKEKDSLVEWKQHKAQATETTLRESGFLYRGTYANLSIGNILWLYCALFWWCGLRQWRRKLSLVR